MKRLLLLFLFAMLCACSNDKVAGISTVETENAYLIQIVHEDSVPAVGVLARMRAASFVRSVENDSAGAAYYEEFVTDSLGCIRIDSLGVDVATIEIVDKGKGLFQKIFAKDLREFDGQRFVLAKTGSMRGRVYLPEGVDHAWIQVYGTDRLVKTDSEGFYEMDSLPAYDYDLRVVVGDSIVDEYAEVWPGKETLANVRTFEPDSIKVLDFESADAQFVIRELGISKSGYMSSTDTSVKTTPEVAIVPETREDIAEFFVEAGAGRDGNALHWVSSAGHGYWSFYGTWVCPEESPCNLSATDSIVFYARGNGVISIALETLGSSNEEGKTLAYDTLKTDKWERRVITPANFKPRDDKYGNLGWDVVSKSVTTISIAAYDETEFWIDDVVFYGVKPSDFIAK
ncbi:MAG: hypothetical protein J6P30_01660 [Fibrobacter sp.]|nr:hypothetical protein [Fibrobacter sp.]